MAVSETRAIRGGVRLTFFAAVGGDPDESGRFGGLGERGYNEEAEKQGKMRGHLSSKGGCRDANNPGGHPSKKATQLLIGSAWDCGCQWPAQHYMVIMKFLLKNPLSGPQNAL
jgi:hypothetical protein